MSARQPDERRKGRGRLSTIDMLPEEADEDVSWALEQLRERSLPQNVILLEFNERLADKGIEQVSKSTFNRYAVRKAVQWRRLDEAQSMAGELAQSMGTDSSDQMTVIVAEMLKVAAFELLEKDSANSKGLMELSRALQSAVSAQRGSEEYRRKLEQRVSSEVEKAADRAEEFGREAGLSAEQLAQMRRSFLGVKPGGAS